MEVEVQEVKPDTTMVVRHLKIRIDSLKEELKQKEEEIKNLNASLEEKTQGLERIQVERDCLKDLVAQQKETIALLKEKRHDESQATTDLKKENEKLNDKCALLLDICASGVNKTDPPKTPATATSARAAPVEVPDLGPNVTVVRPGATPRTPQAAGPTSQVRRVSTPSSSARMEIPHYSLPSTSRGPPPRAPAPTRAPASKRASNKLVTVISRQRRTTIKKRASIFATPRVCQNCGISVVNPSSNVVKYHYHCRTCPGLLICKECDISHTRHTSKLYLCLGARCK